MGRKLESSDSWSMAFYHASPYLTYPINWSYLWCLCSHFCLVQRLKIKGNLTQNSHQPFVNTIHCMRNIVAKQARKTWKCFQLYQGQMWVQSITCMELMNPTCASFMLWVQGKKETDQPLAKSNQKGPSLFPTLRKMATHKYDRLLNVVLILPNTNLKEMGYYPNHCCLKISKIINYFINKMISI